MQQTARRGDVTWFRVTDACNAHCTFCAEHVPRATPDLRDRSAFDRLDALLAGGVPSELLLTGGEPTLHPRLGALIERAKAAGVADVVLFTNAMALGDARRVARLQRAGLSRVRASLFGVDERSRIAMRHPDGWELAAAGVDAAVDAGLPVELASVICRDTVAGLAELATAAVARWPAVTNVVLAPFHAQGQTEDDATSQDHHVHPRAAEADLRRALRIWAAAGVTVAPDPGYGYHLCAFAKPHGLASLLRQQAPSGDHDLQHPAACETCVVRRRCSGVEASLLRRFGDDLVQPWTDRRRALWQPLFERTVASDRTDRIAVRQRDNDGRAMREQVIRILHACNQRCAFCWVDFSAPTMTAAAVEQAIVQNMARLPAGESATITFTGGEPTLHPDLATLIARACELGAARVQVQTNAIRCADPDVAQALATAGLDEALVSLHAPDAEASDTLTAAPGTFARSVQGIRNLCAAGVDVVINHVLTREQAPHFPEFVRFVGAELAHERLVMTVAVAGRIDRGPLDEDVLPTLSELAEPVRAGLRIAHEIGVSVRDLSHPCGIPPCILGADIPQLQRAHLRGVSTKGVVGEAEGCIKPETCRRCLFDGHCFGVRREYADEHGTGELTPILSEATSE